jgi:Helix-turn-helix of insertion element transposase
MKDKLRKLTKKQKRAAKLLAAGYKPTKVAKLCHVSHYAIWEWRKIPKFIKLQNKYTKEFDSYIDQKQRSLLDKTFKALDSMLSSHNVRSVQFAIETVLRVNNRNPESRGRMIHEGTVGLQHEGDLKIKKRTLKPKDKQHIKDLLDATRHLTSSN